MRILNLGAVVALRDADWLNGQRASGYVRILLAVTLAVIAVYLGFARGLVDPLGKAVGTDFAGFWTASELALKGQPAGAWDMSLHGAAQKEWFGAKAGYAAFLYPPPYLLVCLPLALIPYLPALAVWVVATGLAYLKMARAWLEGAPVAEAGLLAVLAFPAVFVNAGHGQNGFLTAALLGAAAMLHSRRPWLAGVFFGMMVIKPHLAVMAPIFLIVAGNWRSFLAAALTALGLCAASLLIFGPDAWVAFANSSSAARGVLDQDLIILAKIQSIFAAVRLTGGDSGLASVAQAIGALGAAAAIWAVRRKTSGKANGAVFACATLLATPYLYDYDLTLLLVPLIWLWSRGVRDGFLPWEKTVLLIGYLTPLITRTLASEAHVPITPFVVVAVLACVIRRAQLESGLDPGGVYSGHARTRRLTG